MPKNKFKDKSWLFLLALLVFHGWLVWDTAQKMSPVWDEPIYAYAGWANLKLRKNQVNTEHPPLAKAFLSLPNLGANKGLDDVLTEPDQYRASFQFVKGPEGLGRLSRARMISLVFSLGLLVLLFITGGAWPALIYSVNPLILGHASLALLDIQVAFWLTLSWILFSNWENGKRSEVLLGAGMALTAALLSKYVAVFLGAWFGVRLLQLKIFKKNKKKFIKSLFLLFGPSVVGLLLLHFMGWGSFLKTQSVTSDPFPAYFFGSTYDQPRLYFWPIAFFLKTPFPFLVLLVLSVRKLMKGQLNLTEKNAWGAVLTFVVLIVLAFTVFGLKRYFSIRHLAVAIPFLAYCIRPVFKNISKQEKIVMGLLMMWLVGGALVAHPFHLNYFNEFVGGPKKGFRYLSDADQDWGQGLRLLSRYVKINKIENVILCYSGSSDPRSEGLESFQDLISPALYIREDKGDLLPVDRKIEVLAVSAKTRQSESYYLAPLLRDLSPIDTIGGLFFIYDVSNNSKAHEIMSDIYSATHRPRWALREQQKVNWLKEEMPLIENEPFRESVRS